MSDQTVSSAGHSSAATRQPALYARVLRLRHLNPSGLLCFVFFEAMVALGVLLALAELTDWWSVVVLPASVAAMVKINDAVAAAVARSANRAPEQSRANRAQAGPAPAGLVRAPMPPSQARSPSMHRRPPADPPPMAGVRAAQPAASQAGPQGTWQAGPQAGWQAGPEAEPPAAWQSGPQVAQQTGSRAEPQGTWEPAAQAGSPAAWQGGSLGAPPGAAQGGAQGAGHAAWRTGPAPAQHTAQHNAGQADAWAGQQRRSAGAIRRAASAPGQNPGVHPGAAIPVVPGPPASNPAMPGWTEHDTADLNTIGVDTAEIDTRDLSHHPLNRSPLEISERPAGRPQAEHGEIADTPESRARQSASRHYN